MQSVIFMMKRILIGFVCLSFLTAACCFSAGGADSPSGRSVTYDFDDITIAQALMTISQDTGIEIKAPFDALQNKVRKNYTQADVDKIVTDLLRRQNYAIIWHYDDQQLVTIDIRIDDQQGQSRGLPPALADPGTRGRAVSDRISGRKRPLPPAIGPGRYRGVERPPMPPGI